MRKMSCMWIYYDCRCCNNFRLKDYIILLFSLPVFFIIWKYYQTSLGICYHIKCFCHCFGFSYITFIAIVLFRTVLLSWILSVIISLCCLCRLQLRNARAAKMCYFLSMLFYLFCKLKCMVFKICFRKKRPEL